MTPLPQPKWGASMEPEISAQLAALRAELEVQRMVLSLFLGDLAAGQPEPNKVFDSMLSRLNERLDKVPIREGHPQDTIIIEAIRENLRKFFNTLQISLVKKELH